MVQEDKSSSLREEILGKEGRPAVFLSGKKKYLSIIQSLCINFSTAQRLTDIVHGIKRKNITAIGNFDSLFII